MSWEFNIPRANPLRFHQLNIPINFDTVMPRFDMMELGKKYQAGEEPISIRPDWVKDKELALQIEYTHPTVPATVPQFYIFYEDGTYDTVTVTNITPGGWIGYKRWKLTCIPTVAGFYYIVGMLTCSSGSVYVITDEFYVHENISDKKNLIELKYKNLVNDLGMVWDDYYTAYYTAKFDESDGEVENSVFKTDTGTTLLNSIVYDGIEVTFCDIQKRYKGVIKQQLRCDDLLFNNMACVCSENISSEKTDKADVLNITAKLSFTGTIDYLDIID